jgi:excisionase family DNA binding protein
MGLGSPLTRSVPEAAELLGIGRNAAYEAVRRGQIPAIRVGRRWLVPVLALDQLLRAQTPQGPKAEVPKNLTRIRKRSRRQQ